MAYAEQTKVPLEQSIAEIIGMVRKAGAEQVGQFDDSGAVRPLMLEGPKP